MSNNQLKIGILGMTEGNGHPYSWSAIFNGYQKEYMDKCPFPVIPAYLYNQPENTFGIEGARVTHICCTGYADRKEAELIAKASKIDNVTDRPEDMIGGVDAVICATDDGNEHVERCRPFLEKGIPMFIDKPLVNNEEDLSTFINWKKEGKRFISGSSLRYTKELEVYHKNHYELGELVYICQPMAKKFENYGIHALEAVYPLLGKGFISVQNLGEYAKDMLVIEHESGCRVNVVHDKMSSIGTLIIGTKAARYVTSGDSYYSFKKQLECFLHWLKTGVEPFDFSETVELMKLVIAGLKSREQGGKKIMLKDILI